MYVYSINRVLFEIVFTYIPISSAIFSLTTSAAWISDLSVRCVYLFVIVCSLCPNRPAIIASEYPKAAIVAKLCRKAWAQRFSNPGYFLIVLLKMFFAISAVFFTRGNTKIFVIFRTDFRLHF